MELAYRFSRPDLLTSITDMKVSLTILASFSLILSTFADEAAARKTAEAIITTTRAAESMKSGFVTTIDPMIAGMKKQGMPEAAAAEMRTAMSEWFDTEVKWSEIKPKLVDLYVKEFTEQELKDLLAFYQTPTGQKAIVKLPVIMREGGSIGQEMVGRKQESLKQSLQRVVEKYRPKPKAPAAPSAPTPESLLKTPSENLIK